MHGLSKYVWHQCVPLKWSFLTWRALQNNIPLDDCLVKRGFSMVSKCACCASPQVQTISHVFITRPVSIEVWDYFDQLMSIRGNASLSCK